jgi:two-component system phosphate regulon sensor histidine kinase PhoR
MNRKWISILTFLTVFGLAGLTIVQIIWLRNAIHVEEQRFDNTVTQVLQEIADKVEHFEYQPFVKDLIAANAAQLQNLSATDTYKSITSQQDLGDQKIFLHIDDGKDSALSIEIDFSKSNQWVQQPAVDFGSSNPTATPGMEVGHLPISIMVDPNELAEKFLAQRKAINEMVMRQIFSLQPITEVLDTGKIKGIIEESLVRHGIKTPFEFGITEYTLNNFVFVSTAASLEKLYDSKYLVSLFPGNVYHSQKQLMLIFPARQKYLLQSIWLPLSFSALFIILIAGSFGLALYIIFKQKQLSNMKMDFINNMTHELKTPISTISLASEMLRDDSIAANSNSRLKYAGVIYDENKRLAIQVDKVLQMARLEKGEIKYNMNPIDLHELIEVALSQFYIQIEDIGGQLHLNLDAENSIILADELHLTNVVNNLLDNALKYNDKQIPVISVNTKNSNGMLILSVKDNGVGIRKEDIKKIFEQFYRVNKGDVHDTKGFGIGLSYVKSIIDAHKGTIEVQSKLGEGTVFIIQLPLQKV